MTPFEVYLLMMADSVRASLAFVTIACGLVFIGSLIAFGMASDSYCGSEPIARAIAPWPKRLLVLGVAALVINTFVPGTKTLAAMYVLPKLTTPHALDTMSKDGQQLYDLTIAALKHMAGEDKGGK